MSRQLWQILLDESTELTCEECFALTEYYAEVLAGGGERLLPRVLAHLKNCPECSLQHSQALRRLTAIQIAEEGASPPSVEADGPAQRGHRDKMAGEDPWRNQSA